MSMKAGGLVMEWTLLHIRNGEQIMGLVEVPKNMVPEEMEANKYHRCFAAELMQSKTYYSTPSEEHHGVVHDSDHIIELRNPHQVIVNMGPQGQPQVAPLPLTLGNKIIFLRSGEILYVQFLDEASPLVRNVRQAMSGIAEPSGGSDRTAGGIIIPGSGPKA